MAFVAGADVRLLSNCCKGMALVCTMEPMTTSPSPMYVENGLPVGRTLGKAWSASAANDRRCVTLSKESVTVLTTSVVVVAGDWVWGGVTEVIGIRFGRIQDVFVEFSMSVLMWKISVGEIRKTSS